MALALSLSFTDTSLVLLTVIIGLSLYSKYFSGYTPLVHPLLLRKQSDVSQTRKEGESAVYRSWATGHGTPFATSPSGAVKIVADVLRTDTVGSPSRFGSQVSNSKLLDQANDILQNIALLAPHLLSTNSETAVPTYILSLLPPSLPLLQLHLARSLTNQLRLITLGLPIFLVSALESESHPRPRIVFVTDENLHGVVEQLVEKDGHAGDECKALVVVVPEQDGQYRENTGLIKKADGMGVKVVSFEQLQRPCMKADEWERPVPNDIHALAYLPRGRDNSNPHLVEITNQASPLPSGSPFTQAPDPQTCSIAQNLTAGMAACLSAFPASLRPAAQTKDVIQSCVDINEPFGLGLMLASLLSGAGFEFVKGGKKQQSLAIRPTIAFIHAKDLAIELDQIEKSASSSFFYSTAKRQRLAALDEGYVSKSGWMENMVWKAARKGSALDGLRALFVVGETPDPDLTLRAHMLLSMPFTRIYTTPISAGPILVSHFNDLQSEGKERRMHSGAPASNVEVMLKGEEVEKVEMGGNPTGQMLARGPAVLKDLNLDVGDDRWTPVAKRATAWSNGTFVIA